MAIDKYGAVALRKTYTRYYNTELEAVNFSVSIDEKSFW